MLKVIKLKIVIKYIICEIQVKDERCKKMAQAKISFTKLSQYLHIHFIFNI